MVVTNGGVYRPKAYVGNRLVRLLPDPFFDLIRQGDLAALKVLPDLPRLAREQVDQTGRTALYVAVARGQLEVVDLLLSVGAPINAQNRNLEGATPLMAALYSRQVSRVIAMITRGADVNVPSGIGRPPLTVASRSGGPYEEYLAVLLAAGANPDARDRQGRTAREDLVHRKVKSHLIILDGELGSR